jgi:hypothetical protein
MQARPIRRGPSSSSLSADPQGGRQAPLTLQDELRTRTEQGGRVYPYKRVREGRGIYTESCAIWPRHLSSTLAIWRIREVYQELSGNRPCLAKPNTVDLRFLKL